ncbi:hypothetical protein QL285_076674 [Trifolium repens]|nr:hypothetical protein QL285_076674 [Trifolium repens]
MGRIVREEVDYEDTISLLEVRGGADSKEDNSITAANEIDSTYTVRRGRSRIQRDKSKIATQSRMRKPKFIQLGEALKDEGGRRRRKNRGGIGKGCSEEEGKAGSDEDIQKGSDSIVGSSEEGSSSSIVPNSVQGITLEVILPGIQSTPSSGLALLRQQESHDEGTQQREQVIYGSAKLLQIQQQIGFCYSEPAEEVIKVLENDEQRDLAKKQEWEQLNGFQ